MTEDELRHQLAEIIALERASNIDWERVSTLSLSLVAKLVNDGGRICPTRIYRFIDDFDIRKRDAIYADKQRAEVSDFLERH